jgi:hypothetical protein
MAQCINEKYFQYAFWALPPPRYSLILLKTITVYNRENELPKNKIQEKI